MWLEWRRRVVRDEDRGEERPQLMPGFGNQCKASGFSGTKMGSLCKVLSHEGHDLTDLVLTRCSGCCVEKKL